MYPPTVDACFTLILKCDLAGSLFYMCVSMISFCAWIKGYCRFSACKRGWFSIRFQKYVSAYTMPKTADRDIHGMYKYDVSILVFWLVKNKGADQPTHLHSLISAFVFRSFESIISRLSVAKKTGLSLALSITLKTSLFCVEAQINYSRSLFLFVFTTAFSFGCFKELLTCFRLTIVGPAKSIQE